MGQFRSITFRAVLVWGALWAVGSGWLAPPQAVLGAEPLNFVYILADDLGYGDLGCYGQKTLKTPHLDRMAREGMRFTQHYAGSTVCAPSRCVLLTGLHSGHNGIRSNGNYALKDEDVTVAEVLKRAGYRTGCMGKWGVGRPPTMDDPRKHGFDYFYGYISMMHAHNFYPDFIVRNGERVPLQNVLNDEWKEKSKDGRGVASVRREYVPDLITREALSFIERNQKRPFFLYYSLNVPHANNEAGDAGMEVPDLGEFAARDWPAPEKGFAAMLRNIDNDVGRVLERLKALGLDDRTLVIFTSDNGPHAEGGHKVDFFDSNGPLRGFKRDYYEGGIRVPMIARLPGRIQPNSVSDHISSFQDILATFADIAGLEAPGTDGISMAPTLFGRPEAQGQHDYLFWQLSRRVSYRRGVRRGHWKAVLYPGEEGDGKMELYDLSQDLGEEKDLAAEHPEVVEEMSKIMAEAHVPLDTTGS